MTDRVFLALADPGRRAFIERLVRGPATATDLATGAPVQLPAVLKQLQMLEDSGLISSGKSGRVRTYRLRPEAFDPVRRWIDARQAELEAAFDRLERLMAEIPEERPATPIGR